LDSKDQVQHGVLLSWIPSRIRFVSVTRIHIGLREPSLTWISTQTMILNVN
jgi:hypothetical protein